jgi:hypothetical protein
MMLSLTAWTTSSKERVTPFCAGGASVAELAGAAEAIVGPATSKFAVKVKLATSMGFSWILPVVTASL